MQIGTETKVIIIQIHRGQPQISSEKVTFSGTGCDRQRPQSNSFQLSPTQTKSDWPSASFHWGSVSAQYYANANANANEILL
jgi:hypothetical protein